MVELLQLFGGVGREKVLDGYVGRRNEDRFRVRERVKAVLSIVVTDAILRGAERFAIVVGGDARACAGSRPCDTLQETYMALDKNDESVLGNIDRLVKEEEQLYAKKEFSEEDRARMADLKVHLDQCWDLLRQRRALREFGKDPDEAKVRPAKIVENYEQ